MSEHSFYCFGIYAMLNLKCKKKTSERYRRIQAIKRGSDIPYKPECAEEPDEGLLYDELY